MPADLAPTKAAHVYNAPLLGTVADGYRLVDVLGAGGMSIVYRGEQPEGAPRKPVQVAIKVLQSLPPPQPAARARLLARFRREAQVAMSLHHPHIVPMLGSGEIDGQPYVIFPFIAGGTLAARLAQRSEPLGFTEAERYAEQVAAALDYAHTHGVVHRDVKPSNILLDGHGDAYLADFGIAHLFEGGIHALEQPDGTDITSLTTTGEVIGTPSYMAPEQFHGQPVGPATDVYALGIVLYQLATGRLPFTGETPIATGLHHLHDAPRDPRILRPDLPTPAAAAILRALAKAPEQRFSSAGDLAQAFAAGLQGRWIGQHPEQTVFYPGAPVETPVGMLAQPFTATTTTQPVHSTIGPRIIPPFGGSHAQGHGRVASISGVLLLLGALVLALHGLNPGGETAQRARVSASTPTHAPAVATQFRYAGARVFALDASGNALWTTPLGMKVISLTVANGRVYAKTTHDMTYILQASNGQILTRQSSAPPKNNGGDDNGD